MHRPLNKIMHVDDDPVMRLMTGKALERSQLGLTIESYSTAKEAIENIDVFNPDLLLVDLLMPIMNGEELITEIRKSNSTNKNCPVIFISGKENIKFTDKQEIEPIIGIINKPFSAGHIGQDILNMWNEYNSRSQT